MPYCHTESVYIKFSEAVNLELIQEELQRAGIKIDAEVSLPSQVAGTNDVHVCRLRKQAENELLMVIVADNLRRGAAYNAVLIFEFLIKNLIKKG